MSGASGTQDPGITFRPASPEDAETISAMAHKIWHQVYSEMIGADQIKYMLEWMYAPDTLRREMAQEGHSYIFIDVDASPSGYLGYSAEGSVTLLNKLYLDANLHGRGIGSAALRWLVADRRDANSTAIRLRVNKGNRDAIRAYERNGFVRTGAVCDDIGDGFVMDDYIYTLPL